MYEPALTLFAMTSRTRLGRLRPRWPPATKSTEIVHLTLQCSPQIAGRVWRVRVKGAGVISITVKPNRSRISLSAAFCDLIGDELDAGLARSSGISVEDFQTQPHDLWVLAPI